MSTESPSSITEAALAECDREPIHVPGSIQPHGALIALRWPDATIRHASLNAGPMLGLCGGSVVGRRLDDLFGPEPARRLAAALDGLQAEGAVRHLGNVAHPRQPERSLTALAHRHDGPTVIEIETTGRDDSSGLEDVYPLTTGFLTRLRAAADAAELHALAATEVRRLTGFDRVLVYRFEEDGSGTVVAEERNETLPSYLGHRFPESDIPKQARDLYRINRLRLIADASYAPVPIHPSIDPETGRPLDLTYAALRSVSPIHLEYMRNMGTAASMSISVMREDNLWGLISCHHATPRVVPFLVRAACDFMGQVFSLQLAAKEHGAQVERSLELRMIQGRLLASMTEGDDYIAGLERAADDLLALADASGAAVVSEGRCALIGETPTEPDVRRLAAWLAENGGREVHCTQSLAAEFPEAETYRDRASGLLAIGISKLHPSYVLWFRPEVTRTLTWAGDPRKTVEISGDRPRLHPRRSFAMWQETVRMKAPPFSPSEVEAAVELRNSILGIVLRRAEELAALSEELTRSNKELEAFSYSVSHDLRAPFRHIVGYAELLRDHAGPRLDPEEIRYLETIGDAARQAGLLVDNLLAFSRMGRARLELRPIDMNRLVDEVRQGVMNDAAGREVRWTVGPLPTVEGDVMMIRQLVENLFSNALKFTRHRDVACVEVGTTRREGEHEFFVRDNGVGFDMTYAGKLFGVFQRMHRMEDYEGTGIGLANVRRIAARHGGRTWAVGAVDEGATFYFTLPATPADRGGVSGTPT